MRWSESEGKPSLRLTIREKLEQMKTWTWTRPVSQNDFQTGNGRAIKQEVLVGNRRVGGERARIRALLCLVGSGLVVRESQDVIVGNARGPGDD